MYGVLRATCGSNPLGVDDENEFPNELNTLEFMNGIRVNINEIKLTHMNHHLTFNV